MAKKGPAPLNNPMNYHWAKSEPNTLEKIGQLFMPAVFINETEEEIAKMEQLIREHHIGGICFFHSKASAATNFEGKEEEVQYNEDSIYTLMNLVQRYQNAARYPLLVAIDAEWGLAMRIENTPQFPYHITLGAIDGQDELIYQVGRHIALDCKKAGIHWNFAPVVDINLNPANPVIGYRSFGEDKTQVCKKALAFMKGMQSEGLLTAAKHFPGHGDTATDSHLGLPVIDKTRQSLEANEFYPFKCLVDAGVDAVMVGHLAVPSLTGGKIVPATVSGTIVNKVLRQGLGFDGVVVSDALNMHSVSRMFPAKGQLEWEVFNAGVDLLCFAEHIPEGIGQILEKASGKQINAAFERVWNLKEQVFANVPSQPESKEDDQQLIRRLAEASITLVKGSAHIFELFRKAGFSVIEVGHPAGQPFPESLKGNGLEGEIMQIHPESQMQGGPVVSGKNIVVALYPSSVKPMNNFGISEQVCRFIHILMTQNTVILYLFGNPFALNVLKHAKAGALVLAYQDFRPFQETATRHFLGEIQAAGKLPVSLNQQTG